MHDLECNLHSKSIQCKRIFSQFSCAYHKNQHDPRPAGHPRQHSIYAFISLRNGFEMCSNIGKTLLYKVFFRLARCAACDHLIICRACHATQHDPHNIPCTRTPSSQSTKLVRERVRLLLTKPRICIVHMRR